MKLVLYLGVFLTFYIYVSPFSFPEEPLDTSSELTPRAKTLEKTIE